jgi:hypothetical protein
MISNSKTFNSLFFFLHIVLINYLNLTNFFIKVVIQFIIQTISNYLHIIQIHIKNLISSISAKTDIEVLIEHEWKDDFYPFLDKNITIFDFIPEQIIKNYSLLEIINTSEKLEIA